MPSCQGSHSFLRHLRSACSEPVDSFPNCSHSGHTPPGTQTRPCRFTSSEHQAQGCWGCGGSIQSMSLRARVCLAWVGGRTGWELVAGVWPASPQGGDNTSFPTPTNDSMLAVPAESTEPYICSVGQQICSPNSCLILVRFSPYNGDGAE